MYKENLIFDLKTIKRNLEKDIKDIDSRIYKYRKGSLCIQNGYCYLKWYDNGKVVSRYIGKNLSNEQIEDIKRGLKNRQTLERRRVDCEKELKEINKIIERYQRKLK